MENYFKKFCAAITEIAFIAMSNGYSQRRMKRGDNHLATSKLGGIIQGNQDLWRENCGGGRIRLFYKK